MTFFAFSLKWENNTHQDRWGIELRKVHAGDFGDVIWN